jgi:hypothetical protein
MNVPFCFTFPVVDVSKSFPVATVTFEAPALPRVIVLLDSDIPVTLLSLSTAIVYPFGLSVLTFFTALYQFPALVPFPAVISWYSKSSCSAIAGYSACLFLAYSCASKSFSSSNLFASHSDFVVFASPTQFIESKATPQQILTALNVAEGTWTQAGLAFDSINWVGEAKTTKSEWDAKRLELENDFDAQEYARNRQAEYPAIAEQLDLLYHDMTAGKGTKAGNWYKAVKKVKTDNPKG